MKRSSHILGSVVRNMVRLIAPGLVFPLCLWATSAQAQSLPRHGLSIEPKGGYLQFHQGAGYAPLCCGERDEWTVDGPGGSLTLGYALAPWVRPSLEVGVGRMTGEHGIDQQDVTITLTEAALGVDFFIGDEIAFVPHAGVYLLHLSGTFDRLDYESIDESSLYGGPGAGVGLAWRLTPSIDLRLDGSAGLIANTSDSTWQSLNLGATWWMAP